jgi:hypothetical protein
VFKLLILNVLFGLEVLTSRQLVLTGALEAVEAAAVVVSDRP